MSLSIENNLLNHKQLRFWVADRLRSDILNGRLKPGEWLRQERLAQDYGVSQMPVREALKELAAEGLVEHVPYRGVQVIQFTVEDVEDLYATRSFLEGRAARAAAQHISPEQIAGLKLLQEKIMQRQQREYLNEYRDLNRLFHLTIIDASQHAYLTRTLHQMWGAFPTMLYSNFTQYLRPDLAEQNSDDIFEHEAIMAALERHDGEEAEKLTIHHIDVAGRMLVEELRRQPS